MWFNFSSNSKKYREDSRKISCECKLFILTDRVNLKLLEFLASNGVKISGVFTDISKLGFELVSTIDKYRLLVIDTGSGNFSFPDNLNELVSAVSTCTEGNKCTVLTSDTRISERLKEESANSGFSLMVREYVGVACVLNTLVDLDENYISSNTLKESLLSLIDTDILLSLTSVPSEEVNISNSFDSKYHTSGLYERLIQGEGEGSIKYYDNIVI